jgi:Tfp pilus assembly protein PilX
MRYLMQKNIHNQKGFALLLSVLISVIVLTIGLTILNSTLKQLTLSETSLESERAFHAAYAGVECAQFWNVADVWDVGTSTQSIRCMDQNVTTNNSAPLAYNAHEVWTIQFDWQAADGADGTYTYDMCTDMTIYKYKDNAAATTMTVLPAGFTNRICAIGVECTVVESRGYNRPCGSLTNIRTIEREMTVRF